MTTKGNSETNPSDKSTRERLATEWNSVKHLLPSGELKDFLCRVVIEKMEEWAGNEPPRATPLTVVCETQDNCDHHFVKNVCQKCQLKLYTDDDYGFGAYPHISPYSGGGLGW